MCYRTSLCGHCQKAAAHRFLPSKVSKQWLYVQLPSSCTAERPSAWVLPKLLRRHVQVLVLSFRGCQRPSAMPSLARFASSRLDGSARQSSALNARVPIRSEGEFLYGALACLPGTQIHAVSLVSRPSNAPFSVIDRSRAEV
jgi:hypothetical protein